MTWDAVTATSTLITTGIVLVAATIALRQVEESINARGLDAVLGFTQKLESEALNSTREFLYVHRDALRARIASDNSYEHLQELVSDLSRGDVTIGMLRHAFATWENAALLAVHNMLPAEVERAYFIPFVSTTWPLVEPVVTVFRQRRQTPVYLQHLEALHNLVSTGEPPTSKLKKALAKQLELASLRFAIYEGSQQLAPPGSDDSTR